MTTLRAIFHAFAPEYCERSPPLPASPRKVLSAIQQCQSGHEGHRRSQCPSGSNQHRLHHACGNRHCPPCQQHTTQQGLSHPLERQLPGPHFLLPFPVPATLRPFIRSHQRLAYQVMFNASSEALKRLATDERFIGTARPGCTGVRPTWGRQLPYHPHLHSSVPGGGLSQARTTWRPARATCFVPVKALSPIYRAIFKDHMGQTGLREHIAPPAWNIPWNVQRQANAKSHTACTSLAPSVCKVAISHQRIVGLKDCPVTFTYRKPGSARPRTTALDVSEFLRRFLQHVLPDGCMKVRHCGFLHASWAIPPDLLCRMIVQARPIDFKPARIVPPQPLVALCPTCGAPMRVVMRLWTSTRAFVDTG